jgi:superfamily I DNA and/or RNA helicase
MADLPAHLAHLERLVELERAEERSRFDLERSSLSLSARQERGHALLDLKVTELRALAGRMLVELAPTRHGREIPASLIGAGTPVRLARRRAEDDEEVRGVVSRLSRGRITVALDALPPDWVESGVVCLELIPSEVTYERLQAGLRRLARGESKTLEQWRSLLVGNRAPQFDPHPERHEAPQLNAEQVEALNLAMNARDVALVHGPPGTGKTTVLAEIIERAAARGERVLAAAASNLAVDNLLERVAPSGLKVLRLGHVARVLEPLLPLTLEEQTEAHPSQTLARELLDEAHALLARSKKLAARGRSTTRFAESRQARFDAARLFSEARERMRGVREQIVSGAQVVFVTCTGAEVELLDRQQFDLAVIDEATQATEPAVLLPLMKARRAVLAGDPCQLSPTVLSPEAARQGLARSLFERWLELFGPAIGRTLREQHRMHEAIMAFPSRAMYRGELRAHPLVAGWTLADLPGVQGSCDLSPLLFLDTAGKGFDDEVGEDGESRRNPQEAALVARRVRALLQAGVPPSGISVIAPYSAQVQQLRALLPGDEMEIDTVDGFQGRENDAVVVSLTRSNALGELGFLNDIRRMNVAITRARRQLLVVGDSATLGGHAFYRGFIDQATAAGGYRSAWDEPG